MPRTYTKSIVRAVRLLADGTGKIRIYIYREKGIRRRYTPRYDLREEITCIVELEEGELIPKPTGWLWKRRKDVLNWAKYTKGQTIVSVQHGKIPSIPIDLVIDAGDGKPDRWLFVLDKDHGFVRMLTVGDPNTCLAEFGADQKVEDMIHILGSYEVVASEIKAKD